MKSKNHLWLVAAGSALMGWAIACGGGNDNLPPPPPPPPPPPATATATAMPAMEDAGAAKPPPAP
ncbi:MAG: hypothetical protein ACREJX_07025, partial [Polyangiaceae bacterium]